MKGLLLKLFWLLLWLTPVPLRGESEGTMTMRPRVVVSSDIGGTDPDDFQSMVHLLLCADRLEIEGILSSPFGPGRKDDILKVIDRYQQDYPKLTNGPTLYPTPDQLRSVTKQGECESAPHDGFRLATEGSEWLIASARRDDPRPLHLLVWGGLEDLAQALHDAPDILPKLRVHFIGGPNKKWSVDAYRYIVAHHPRLWIIESNSTYRGWFVGGNQEGAWGNDGFVTSHVAGHGALGDFFATQLGGRIKMGDSPSVGWLLSGEMATPSQPGWGGSFVRAWDRRPVRFDHLPTREERIECFGIAEVVLSFGESGVAHPEAGLAVENQVLDGHFPGDGTVHFYFCPKEAKTYDWAIHSNLPSLNGRAGGITAVAPVPGQRPCADFPNWWTDDPDPRFAEGIHLGAKSVNRWRKAYLDDFAARLRLVR